jgi:hypothetical protein
VNLRQKENRMEKDKVTLYDLSKEVVALLDQEEFDEEALDKTMGALDKKVNSIGRLVLYLRDEAANLSMRSKGFQVAAAKRERKVEWLMDYLERCMKLADAERFQFQDLFVKFRNLPNVVKVDNEALLPESTTKTKPEVRVPDLKKIKELWDANIEVPGTHLETKRRKLEVKSM